MTAATAPEAGKIAERDVRPQVSYPQSRLPVYLFIAAMALLAILLFSALSARREQLASPDIGPLVPDLAQGSVDSPALFVPPAGESVDVLPSYAIAIPPPLLQFESGAPAGIREAVSEGGGLRIRQPPARIYQPQPLPASYGQDPMAVPPPDAPRAPGGPALVIDVGNAENGSAQPGAPPAGSGAGTAVIGAQGPLRVRSGRLANPSTTVPQGTSIPAVLETALDSTRPGQVRAIVSLDVRGFDGTRVLIPRGSRLYGEYQADLQPGQNRALIQWTRLMRPDGAVIAIASPAGDRLGRAGIRGKVNSHFFEKLFSAVLQSSLDLGVAVASRSIGGGDGGVVLLPGSLGQAMPQTPDIKPTLTVKQGRSISVLVARDLDFTGATGR